MSIASEIVHALKNNKGRLGLRDLIAKFSLEGQPLVELKVMALVRSQNLELKRENQGYLVILKKPIKRKQRSSLTKQPNFEPKLSAPADMLTVATIPTSLQTRSSPPRNVVMTDEAFNYLLSSARKYIKVSLPFPEESVIAHFSTKLKKLAQDGVKIFLLTREVVEPQRRDYHYISLLKAVLRMWDVYRTFGRHDYFSVKDFHENLRLGDSQLVHYESTHAKLILIDGVECYAGSAEFRLNSLYNNFELGFIVKGKPVEEIEVLFDIVWNSGTTVSYDFLRNTVKAPTLQ